MKLNLQISEMMLMRSSQLTFTGVFITTYEVSKNGSNYTHLGSKEGESLSQDQIDQAIWGSKMTFVLEEFLIITIWLIKACILLLYGRLT